MSSAEISGEAMRAFVNADEHYLSDIYNSYGDDLASLGGLLVYRMPHAKYFQVAGACVDGAVVQANYKVKAKLQDNVRYHALLSNRAASSLEIPGITKTRSSESAYHEITVVDGPCLTGSHDQDIINRVKLKTAAMAVDPGFEEAYIINLIATRVISDRLYRNSGTSGEAAYVAYADGEYIYGEDRAKTACVISFSGIPFTGWVKKVISAQRAAISAEDTAFAEKLASIESEAASIRDSIAANGIDLKELHMVLPIVDLNSLSFASSVLSGSVGWWSDPRLSGMKPTYSTQPRAVEDVYAKVREAERLDEKLKAVDAAGAKLRSAQLAVKAFESAFNATVDGGISEAIEAYKRDAGKGGTNNQKGE